MFNRTPTWLARPCLATLVFSGVIAAALSAAGQQPGEIAAVPPPPSLAPAVAPAMAVPPGTVVHKVRGLHDRIEMVISTSRILSLDQKIPQVQVNNPDILDVTPLSPKEVQIAAKKTGVTQVNLWGEDKRIFTVDVTVFGDARELAAVLKAQFPRTTLNVVPVGTAVLLSGYVDQPEHVSRIVQIAEQFYPRVINNMTVSGVQQVLLHVKVMEVSRTKLRKLGFDFQTIFGGTTITSTVNGISPDTATLLVNHTADFTGLLEALREDKLMKIMAEPNLVAISGRPAYFIVGGELGYVIQGGGGVGTTTAAFKPYGTRLDFVPIVQGNGRIRLEVRSEVSEKDAANSPEISDGPPSLKTRTIETGVEMLAGQTLAIGGLLQTRIESQNGGFPWISEVPYLGVPFRRVKEEMNEVELVILVTPELVEAMDAREVPPCGPGSQTTSPGDWAFYMKGHLEVPKCCPNCEGRGCAACARSGANANGAVPQNPNDPSNPNGAGGMSRANPRLGPPSFVGPIGYDVIK
jgi:pilus assembly protein CpaC